MHEINDLAERLNAAFEGRLSVSEDNLAIIAGREDLIPLMRVLRDDYKFGMLADVTAVDYMDYFELVYHVMDFDADLLCIKVRLERADPVMPSLITVWKAADLQEREVYDLMGIVFSGHSNLKRVLCKDDFEGHPLRKDFKLEPVQRF